MTIAELLESVRRVEVRTNRLVNDMMVGAYLSHFKGRGMDFEELREYIPGDEVRDIDWNVTYRMGRPFVKRYYPNFHAADSDMLHRSSRLLHWARRAMEVAFTLPSALVERFCRRVYGRYLLRRAASWTRTDTAP